jgi:hypothetical protein
MTSSKTNVYCEQSLIYLVHTILDQYTVKHLVTISVPFIIVGTILVGN